MAFEIVKVHPTTEKPRMLRHSRDRLQHHWVSIHSVPSEANCGITSRKGQNFWATVPPTPKGQTAVASDDKLLNTPEFSNPCDRDCHFVLRPNLLCPISCFSLPNNWTKLIIILLGYTSLLMYRKHDQSQNHTNNTRPCKNLYISSASIKIQPRILWKCINTAPSARP